MRRALVPSVVLFAATVLSAQGYQCSLVGTHNLHPPYNGCWGYLAPNGKEYALLGSETGLVVVDCTGPGAPVERGWFPWMNSVWREVRSYGQYVYVTTEAAGGFQVISMVNPDAPVDLGIVNTAHFGNAHNLGVDTGTGRIYIVGCNTGSPVFDAAANPANPPLIGFVAGSGNSNYYHDLHCENGYGYGAMIYNGLFRILDLSTFPPTTLSSSTTPAVFTHNAWPTANGSIAVTTDERDGSVIRFYDITNKSAPVPLSQFAINPISVPHNAYIVGNRAHVSWYTEGYQCIDFSDPSTPVVVASYDTYPGVSGGYNGAWGCYPFQPSGKVYISDRSTGLYVLQPHLTDLAIAHAPLPDTTDESAPYVVNAILTSSHAVVSATLQYRVAGGAWQSVAMAPAAIPGNWSGAIPAQDAAKTVEYHIDAQDAQAARRSPRIGEHRFLVGTRVSRWFDGFETTTGWTNGGTSNDFAIGVPFGRTGSSGGFGWQDPMTAATGTRVAGNDLGTATVNGAYLNSANCWLQSPAIPTNGVQNLRLRYRRWLTVASGDTATLRVNGTALSAVSTGAYDTQWEWVEHDLSAITNVASTATIRFELVSNSTNAAGGWTVDDVELFTVHDAAPATEYGVGTPGTAA
ncbi:MAG: choice-of-anchor B family protein, partial [Planctomycetes bacterium]|nr:choice-of-anchor B family protein [Planctomycetota bacterium]